MITPVEAKLIHHFLEEYAEVLSNRGCNDFELVKEMGLTPEESFELRKAMRKRNGDEDEYPEEPDHHMSSDWVVASHMAHRLREEFGIK